MNQYPLWKYLLIFAVLAVGVIYAAPNIHGEDPALQISAQRGAEVDEIVKVRVEDALVKAGLAPRSMELGETGLLARFNDTDTQLKAREVVAAELGTSYTVALNLAPATPEWLRAVGAQPMYLGLDLRGGVHFLMEVDMAAVAQQAEERYIAELRTELRDRRVRYKGITRESDGIWVAFPDAATRDEAAPVLRERFADLDAEDGERAGDVATRLRVKEQVLNETRRLALQQNITTLRNRVNELGVAEPVIQQQGQDRVVVQLPGVQDTARAKEILGATATLEFRMVDDENSVQDALDGRVPVASKLYRTREGESVLLRKRVMLTGDHIIDAASGFEQQSGTPAVFITLDGKGGRIFSEATGENVGRPMAVVFIENKSETQMRDGEAVKVKRTVEEVINIATIREQLSTRFQITGLDSSDEARNLALLLRAGSLAAPIDIIEERTIGPSLGQGNIDRGMMSCVIGFAALAFFMILYYRVFGVIAVLSLAFNVVLLLALMSMLQATLTLPGIAGILLTVGMAVDANVLIYERIREELRNGNSPQASIHAGFERAFSTIADANITTLIAAVMLFSFGTGPVKGFAVTLSLGILTSMFTAILGTRAMVNLFYGKRRNAKLMI